jgi:predicted Zn-dependent protease
MWLIRWLILAAVALPPCVSAQSLPDLGSAGDLVLSPRTERRLGESIVREMRLSEPTYLDDPEISGYLAGIGTRLSQAMTGTRYDFEFFVVRDPTVNAFALPGGFVGVHTGLIDIADTESELASVLAHELAHVTQRHISRMFGQQQQMQVPMMAALAAALLLGHSRPDLASGAAVAIQGAAVTKQLGYSREFEREADRVGLQALSDAGYDPRAMAEFFQKLQRSTRLSDDGSLPGYLRSHPVTVERIADAQNRAANLPYRQHVDSLEFHLVRAKLRAQAGDADDAAAHFRSALAEGRYASEAGARYGYAVALLRARKPREADAEIARLRHAGVADPMLETLAARVKLAQGDKAAARTLLAKARETYPYSLPILYASLETLQEAGRDQEVLDTLAEPIRQHPRDARLRELQARSYAALGKRLLQHQAQAEYYALQGSLPAAIEQLQLARSAGDGDFYQLSVVDARLKDLRAQHAQEAAAEKKR